MEPTDNTNKTKPQKRATTKRKRKSPAVRAKRVELVVVNDKDPRALAHEAVDLVIDATQSISRLLAFIERISRQ